MSYKRVTLYSHWDGMIGPGSHTVEVVVMRCEDCAALVLPGDEDFHSTWHDNITRLAKRYTPPPRYS